MHACPPAVHRDSAFEPNLAPPGRQKARSETCIGNAIPEATPQAHALRCVGHTYPIWIDSKVCESKEPQVRGPTWGSSWGRLRDSNPRPTHYERNPRADQPEREPFVKLSVRQADWEMNQSYNQVRVYLRDP